MPVVREWLVSLFGGPQQVWGPPRRPRVVEKPTWRSVRSREAHPEVQEGSRGTTGSPGGFGSLYLKSWMGRETHLEGRKRTEFYL